MFFRDRVGTFYKKHFSPNRKNHYTKVGIVPESARVYKQKRKFFHRRDGTTNLGPNFLHDEKFFASALADSSTIPSCLYIDFSLLGEKLGQAGAVFACVRLHSCARWERSQWVWQGIVRTSAIWLQGIAWRHSMRRMYAVASPPLRPPPDLAHDGRVWINMLNNV